MSINSNKQVQDNAPELLSKMLNQYATTGQEACQLILDNGIMETYNKNEIIFHINRLNEYEYFQLEGISHRFNTDNTGQLLTTGIYQNQVIITPNFARTKNGLSIFSLQALTDCKLLKVPAKVFNEFRQTNDQIENIAHAVVEKEYINSLNFEVLFRSCSAKERLLYFRSNFSQLENIIPLSIIASFLGITPVSLSRIRNELSR